MKQKPFETNTLKLNDLIVLGENYLLNHNIANYKKEIEWFINDKFRLNLYDIKLKKNIIISQEHRANFIDFINERSLGKPFQYILNKCSFYGYDFYVNSHTLIPRPETELIIDIARKKSCFFDNCLDIGTGSGNISLVLLLQKIVKNVHAIDISNNAISVAKKNKRLHKINKIHFENMDIFNCKIDNKYDLIVSNPPYITLNDYQKLPSEIKKYEPKIALTDSHDGFKFYKKINKLLPDILQKNGTLLIEIGLENTKNEINFIFENSHRQLLWHKDLNDNYRVLEVKNV